MVSLQFLHFVLPCAKWFFYWIYSIFFSFHYFQFHPWPHQHSQGVPCFLVICPLRLLVFLHSLLLVIRGILWQIISRPISLILDPCSNDKKDKYFFGTISLVVFSPGCFVPSLQPPISLSLFCVSEKKPRKSKQKHKGRSFSIAEPYSASAECGKLQLRSIPAKKYLYLHTYNYYDYKLKKQKLKHFFIFFCLKVYSSPKSTELNTIFIDQHKKEYYVNVE